MAYPNHEKLSKNSGTKFLGSRGWEKQQKTHQREGKIDSLGMDSIGVPIHAGVCMILAKICQYIQESGVGMYPGYVYVSRVIETGPKFSVGNAYMGNPMICF